MNIMNSVLHEIQDSELPRNVFHYEITESAYAEITDPGMKFLEDLHDKGAVLLVDDFGSGISSLSTVQDYAFDVIKLDIGFIRKIGNSSRTENIIAALTQPGTSSEYEGYCRRRGDGGTDCVSAKA